MKRSIPAFSLETWIFLSCHSPSQVAHPVKRVTFVDTNVAFKIHLICPVGPEFLSGHLAPQVPIILCPDNPPATACAESRSAAPMLGRGSDGRKVPLWCWRATLMPAHASTMAASSVANIPARFVRSPSPPSGWVKEKDEEEEVVETYPGLAETSRNRPRRNPKRAATSGKDVVCQRKKPAI